MTEQSETIPLAIKRTITNLLIEEFCHELNDGSHREEIEHMGNRLLEAFNFSNVRVKCDTENNPPDSIAAGNLIVDFVVNFDYKGYNDQKSV